MKPFKNIRISLINGGNIKRYLLYAIGEVLLVMIGISLAFQADNWNEDRLKKDEERINYQKIGNIQICFRRGVFGTRTRY